MDKLSGEELQQLFGLFQMQQAQLQAEQEVAEQQIAGEEVVVIEGEVGEEQHPVGEELHSQVIADIVIPTVQQIQSQVVPTSRIIKVTPVDKKNAQPQPSTSRGPTQVKVPVVLYPPQAVVPPPTVHPNVHYGSVDEFLAARYSAVMSKLPRREHWYLLQMKTPFWKRAYPLFVPYTPKKGRW